MKEPQEINSGDEQSGNAAAQQWPCPNEVERTRSEYEAMRSAHPGTAILLDRVMAEGRSLGVFTR